MPSKTVLIGGGYDKDADFSEWVSHFPGKVRKLVLIGQTREKIASACDKIGFTDYCFAEDLEEAVKICYENAESGDFCLLSPACASWVCSSAIRQEARCSRNMWEPWRNKQSFLVTSVVPRKWRFGIADRKKKNSIIGTRVSACVPFVFIPPRKKEKKIGLLSSNTYLSLILPFSLFLSFLISKI